MSHNQRFVLLLIGMLLIGIIIMKMAPAQAPQDKSFGTVVADQFIARGAGDQRTVIDAEGIEITGPQGLITIKSFGRNTEMTLSPRHTGSAIVMSMDGREGSIPYLTVHGDNPAQNVTITVTGNGPKITLHGGDHKKPRIVAP